MKKVREELKKFLERCQKSPHGTEAAREKHEAMTERLQNDIKTQLLNRFLTRVMDSIILSVDHDS